jgi:hypothetical protein
MVAILAVPTAIAEIYGINFEVMPGLKWKYRYFLAIGVIAMLCFLTCRKATAAVPAPEARSTPKSPALRCESWIRRDADQSLAEILATQHLAEGGGDNL